MATTQPIDWKRYNNSLVARGNITIWLSPAAVAAWRRPQSGKRGRPVYFSDLAIEACLTLKSVFQLPLRATEGFVKSLLLMMEQELLTPDYSTLSKRAKVLEINIKAFSVAGNYDLVIDSTGVKIYGEGEWKVRTHGKSKRRKWTKLHLAIDPATHQIMNAKTTHGQRSDCKVLPSLIKNQSIKQQKGYCDGAYDDGKCRSAIIKSGATPIIPPPKNAAKSLFPTNEADRQRSKAVGEIRRLGRKQWKIKIGYHRRSLAETGMFRFKTLTGDRVNSRKIERIDVELLIRCNILNQMAALGMPRIGAVA